MSNPVDHPNQYHEEEPINHIERKQVNCLELIEAWFLIKKKVIVVPIFKDMFEEGAQTDFWLMNWNDYVNTWEKRP